MKTQCPNCKAKFNTNDASVGKQAKCPKCAKPFTIEPFIETPCACRITSKKPGAGSSACQKSRTRSASRENRSPRRTTGPRSSTGKKSCADSSCCKNRGVNSAPDKNPGAIAPPAISAEPTKQEQPESKASSKAALSKTVFVYCWTGVRIIAGILGALGLMLAIRKEEHSTLIATFAAANVFLICSVAIEYTLFYKMWAAIRDSQTSISPAKAVGFLFIPVFNIYWALLMVTGFAEDYNAFIQRRAIKTRDLPMSLFLIYAFAFMLSETVLTTPMLCVFAFLGLISRAFVGYPAAFWVLLAFLSASGIVHFITYILFAFKTCNAINALPASPDASRGGPEKNSR